MASRRTGARTEEGATNLVDKMDLESDTSGEDKGKEKKSIKPGDGMNIALLILLYTLQGIPMGLSASIPYILQEKTHGDYKKQALFSIVSWPFALKLLWAPIVDSTWITSIGRRKSWLIPTQFAIAFLLLWSSGWVDSAIDGEVPDVQKLTYLFLAMYTLCATQDIAVDGWALTMLQPENVHLASVCNSIGQSGGYYLSFIIFLMLSDPNTCNSYFRSVPSEHPLVTLGGFMYFFAFVFLLTTLYVLIFKREKPIGDGDDIGVKQTYMHLWEVLQLAPVQKLIIILLTVRVGFGCVDSVSGLKLQEHGISKESMASIGTAMFPIYLLVPSLIGKFFSSGHPLNHFISTLPFRLAGGVMAIILVLLTQTFVAPTIGENGHGSPPWAILALIFALTVYGVICSSTMFTCQMQFYCLLSDPKIGGSYMTMLNTITNMGGSWPGTLSLQLVGAIEGCDTKKDGKCVKTVDGYYPVAILSICLGVAWYFYFKKHIQELRDLPASAWRTGADKQGGSKEFLLKIAMIATPILMLAYFL